MKTHILVVKDNGDAKKQLNYTLVKLGCEAVYLPNSVEALRFLDSIIPDIIIVDLLMPKISGLNLIKHIRSLPKLIYTPIIMLSINGGAADDEAKKAGATLVLKKPIDIILFEQNFSSYLT